MDSTSLKTSQDIRLERALRRLRLDSSTPASIKRRALSLAQAMIGRLPSNYSTVLEGDIGALYRAIAEEFCRYSESMDGVLADDVHTTVRPELLHQNLAEYLCLGNRSLSTASLGEEAYRSFLIKVRDAYRKGSSKDSLEESMSAILGIPVVLRELYHEARRQKSPYGPKDTHRMVCDILMDSVEYGSEVSAVLEDISFFLSLIKPAHTILETRLLWEDSIGVCGDSKVFHTGVASNANGVTYRSVLTGPARKYMFRAVLASSSDSIAPGDEELVGPSSGHAWAKGVVSSVVSTGNTSITLGDGTVLFVGADTLIFSEEAGGGYRRLLLSEVEASGGSTILYQAQQLAGDFSFHITPPGVASGLSLTVDSQVNQRPSFTDYVVNEFDPSGRFPAVQSKPDGSLSDSSVADVLTPVYEDLRSNHVFPDPQLVSSFLRPDGSGDIVATIGGYSLPMSPVLSRDGSAMATADSVVVYLDGRPAKDVVLSLDPEVGLLSLDSEAIEGKDVRVAYWYADRYPEEHSYEYEETGANAEPGANRLFWPFDRSLVSAVESPTDIQADKIPVLSRLGGLARTSDVKVFVNGDPVPVLSVNPLFGHIAVANAPSKGDSVRVVYHHTDKKRAYALLADQEGHTMDSSYGNLFCYDLVPDSDVGDVSLPVVKEMRSPSSSYKYRAFALGGSSVMNSMDTLKTGDIPVPGTRGSLASNRSAIGASEVVFSPECLTDDRRYLTLDDTYLEQGPDPVLPIPYGTPSFERSFTDGAGLIKSVPLSDLAKGAILPLLYSDLKEKVLSDAGTSPLSPCSDNRDMSLSVLMEEEYFPSREMRLSDYLDYTARKESVSLDDGEIAVLKGSRVIKSTGKNLSMVPKGSVLVVSSGTVSGDHRYTVASVVDSRTILVTEPVSLPSGVYLFDNVTSSIEGREVSLASVRRSALLDLSLTGGTTGKWVAGVVFPDPDTDPYPYSPPNTTSSDVPSVGDVQDYHGHTGQYGNTGLPMSEADAEKMVKWRNWDQDVVLTTYLGATGVSAGDYPSARIRPGASGPAYDLLLWDVYLLGYRGSPPGATGVIVGYTGQVSPGYGPGGLTGSLPYTTLMELVQPGTF